MATIRKRKQQDGKTRYRVEVRLKGFPRQSATFESITDAKKWASETETDIRRGRHFKSYEAKKHTLEETIDRYLKDVLPKKRKGQKKTRALLEWWKKELGPFTLAEVTPGRIVEKRDELSRGITRLKEVRSNSTCNRYTQALSHVLTVASRTWEWMDENPVAKVDNLPEPGARERVLSQEEIDSLLDAASKSRDKRLYAMIVVALSTAMRQGELMKLTWKDVDFQRGMATLRKTKNRDTRSVPITGKADEVLKDRARTPHIGGFVFAGPKSGNEQPRFPQKAWEDALTAAKIEDFRWHDLRHTAATNLAQDGTTLPALAAILGHKTLAMIKRYSHLTGQDTTRYVSKTTERMFGGES